MDKWERAGAIDVFLQLKTEKGPHMRNGVVRKLRGKMACMDHGCDLRFFINDRRISADSVIAWEPITTNESECDRQTNPRTNGRRVR